MDLAKVTYNSLPGRTYSLFGQYGDAKDYYQFIENKLEELYQIFDDSNEILEYLQKSSKRPLFLNKFRYQKTKKHISESFLNGFEAYLTDVKGFVRSLSPLTLPTNTTRTTEEQYKYYMMEAAVTNHINAQKFKDSCFKLALLPHCLRDFRDHCNAREGDIDTECVHCTKECFINHSSSILKKYNVNPYIWTSRNLGSLLKPLIIKYKKIGVLGIACIPELVMGMRRCAKYDIPSIGIPLNANRCVRWMGNYYENSLDIEQLEKLLS